MKKYFVLLLLSFVLVSCGKQENQPITTTEVPKNTEQKISESKNNVVIENNTGEIAKIGSEEKVEKEKSESSVGKWIFFKSNPNIINLSTYKYIDGKIFYEKNELIGANYDNFQVDISFNGYLAKDNKSVYIYGQKIDGADINSIQFLGTCGGEGEFFAIYKDKNNVYTPGIYSGKDLGVDKNTHRAIYGKDPRFDASSFSFIQSENDRENYFIDKNGKYLQSDLFLNKVR